MNALYCENDAPDIGGHSQSEQSCVSHCTSPIPSHTRSQSGHESGHGMQPGQVIHRSS